MASSENEKRCKPKSTCNSCAEIKKEKKTQTISELASTQVANDDDDNIEIISNNDEDETWFSLMDMENLIANCFESPEESGCVYFSGILKFGDDFINNILNENQENDKERTYHNIATSLLLIIEAGSHYYWEIKKIYSHKKKDQLTGEAVVKASPPIDRYLCGGNGKINIDINKNQATIKIEHLIAHAYPTYRENNLSPNAISWISRNINKNLQKIEFYKRLSRNFLEQNNLVDQGYKDISEIILDSTFKTNKEKFELFSILNNYDGFGIPLAYLYVHTFSAPAESKGIQPIFVLTDKDAGEIVAVEMAWSQIVKIQICLWHMECAVKRKLKEKKVKTSQYTLQVANNAKQQFDFIDELWIPNEQESAICSEENKVEILKMIKKHALLHPLIPIKNRIFLTSDEIYYHSIHEIYEYCKKKNLIYLWGYLWVNWYKKNYWSLFARASYSNALPLARTTMLVESHWRTLKSNYKYSSNRPRLDRLTQLITQELVSDQIYKWSRFSNNREFLSWWKASREEWKTALEKEVCIENEYLTDINKWVCSCLAFLENNYMSCKHLVKNYTIVYPNSFPQFKTTRRRHDYPFIYFGKEKIPNINPINNLWNNEISENFLDQPKHIENDINIELTIQN
ncbi:11323_t:CDS:2 [Cetraspora pellucida]|uniref:11323_t:CDS:1 n=1 Tax=Cetraspora pellucida TaxID=1433469 RepID=A0ACA9KJ19_9GLOM|nr:11323_t:CDS:2 [Cetraspora pellucida]